METATASNPSARRLMRVMLLSLLFPFSQFLYLWSETDLFDGEEDWGGVLFMVLFGSLLLGTVAVHFLRALIHPTGKSERFVLLAFIFMVVNFPTDAISLALPEEWLSIWNCLTMPPLLALGIIIYRKLERQWSREGTLLPLPEPGLWPTNRNLLILFVLMWPLQLIEALEESTLFASEWWWLIKLPILLLGLFLIFRLLRHLWVDLRNKKSVF